MAPWAQGVLQCWLHPSLFHPGFRSKRGKTIHCTWTNSQNQAGQSSQPTSVLRPHLGSRVSFFSFGTLVKQRNKYPLLAFYSFCSLSIYLWILLSLHTFSHGYFSQTIRAKDEEQIFLPKSEGIFHREQ